MLVKKRSGIKRSGTRREQAAGTGREDVGRVSGLRARGWNNDGCCSAAVQPRIRDQAQGKELSSLIGLKHALLEKYIITKV